MEARSETGSVGDLFRGVRAQGSLFGSSTLSARALVVALRGQRALTLCTVLEGAGWIAPEGRPPEHLASGETVIVRGPAPFAFVDEIGTEAEPIECGKHCATPEQGGTRHRLGWNDCGPDDPAGATTLVVGAYPIRGEIGRRLLNALPDVLRVAPGGSANAVRDLLSAEVDVDVPGQRVVLDRLLDWMLVCALREWFDRPGGEPPAWYAAHRDPVTDLAEEYSVDRSISTARSTGAQPVKRDAHPKQRP